MKTEQKTVTHEDWNTIRMALELSVTGDDDSPDAREWNSEADALYEKLRRLGLF